MGKNARLEMETWMKMILSIPVILLFVWLGAQVFDLIVQAPDQESIDYLLIIEAEIGDFLQEVESLKKSEFTLPYYVKQDFEVVAYNKDEENLPSKCRKKACLCLKEFDGQKIYECPARFDDLTFKTTNKGIIINKQDEDFFMITLNGVKEKGVVLEIT